MGYYLLDHPNYKAIENDDGWYWGYQQRRGTVTRIIIHTAEIESDLEPPDMTAENIGRYFSRTTTPSSYHDVGDTDSVNPLLPWDHVAFGARRQNTYAYHYSFATKAAKWSSLPASAVTAYLKVAAPRVAKAFDHFKLPMTRLYGDDAYGTSARGYCGHRDTDPSRRTDPGDHFPWARFMKMVNDYRREPVSEFQHPHNDPKIPRFNSEQAIAELIGLDVYSENTPNAGIVATDTLAIYLTKLLASGRLLSAEDVAWLRDMVAYCRNLKPNPTTPESLSLSAQHLRDIRGANAPLNDAQVSEKIDSAVAPLLAEIETLKGMIEDAGGLTADQARQISREEISGATGTVAIEPSSS